MSGIFRTGYRSGFFWLAIQRSNSLSEHVDSRETGGVARSHRAGHRTLGEEAVEAPESCARAVLVQRLNVHVPHALVPKTRGGEPEGGLGRMGIAGGRKEGVCSRSIHVYHPPVAMQRWGGAHGGTPTISLRRCSDCPSPSRMQFSDPWSGDRELKQRGKS